MVVRTFGGGCRGSAAGSSPIQLRWWLAVQDAQRVAHPLGGGPVAISRSRHCARGRTCAGLPLRTEVSAPALARSEREGLEIGLNNASRSETCRNHCRKAVASAKCRARRNPDRRSAQSMPKTALALAHARSKSKMSQTSGLFKGFANGRRWRVGHTAAIEPEGISDAIRECRSPLGRRTQATPDGTWRNSGRPASPLLASGSKWGRGAQIQSIAIPALGCGNGGLDWPEVRKLIETELHGVTEKCEILVFEPGGEKIQNLRDPLTTEARKS